MNNALPPSTQKGESIDTPNTPPFHIFYPERVQTSMSHMRQAGVDQFYVLTDFAKTLTHAYINGEKTPPIVAELRNGKYMTADYAPKAHTLYNTYAHFEHDPSLSLKERKAKMLEWWTVHFQLLAEVGFSRVVAAEAAKNSPIRLREGMEEFINFLEKRGIPLIIISATPTDIAVEMLRQRGLLRKNIHFVGNQYEFDQDGKAIVIRTPIITTLNKDVITLDDPHIAQAIKERKNILLLGDCAEDTKMIEGIAHDELMKFGFINKPDPQQLQSLNRYYDIVQKDDGSMEYINELLANMFA